MLVLDTTLRDGSYVIDFSFSSQQTARISKSLDDAGIPFIEVGHGVGLNAANAGYGIAAESDEAYMAAAAESVSKGKWGMFAIPGICGVEHLDACIDHNIGFVRIGVSINAVEKTRPFIEKARKFGIYCAVNFMKSYTASAIEFEMAARQARAFGADIIYIVDSAGNMVPDQVRRYCERLEDLPFGFHGHNNLGLAMANAIVAQQHHAAIVDCSLQGMGRCTGNTVTEHFVGLMQREGHLQEIDLYALMNLGEQEIRPLLSQKGHSSVDLMCGLVGFHSSYMSTIREYALQYSIDPRRLIQAVCNETQQDASKALVERKAKEVLTNHGELRGRFSFELDQYYGDEQRAL